MGEINFKTEDVENFKVIKFEGNLNYINCTEFEMKLLEELKSHLNITLINLDEKGFIDFDGIEMLQKIFKNNTNVYLVNKQE